jgi:hypothetical protein
MGMSAAIASTRPMGMINRPMPPAAIPKRSAGETAGKASRFAAIVTPGTSWE